MDAIKNPAHSYHSFIFPFIVLGNSYNEKQWLSVGWEKDNDPIDYAAYYYFNPAARSAIFGNADSKTQIVYKFKFNLSSLCTDKKISAKNFFYVIETNQRTYSLKINAVRLRIYNTGIGMIVYDLENNDHTTILDDINKINDYGRRLYMPYINPISQGEGLPPKYCCAACANRIIIAYGEDEHDLIGIQSKALLISQISGVENISIGNVKLPNIITNFIPDIIDISPVIGDRMYVACICQDSKLLKNLSHWNPETQSYDFLNEAFLDSVEYNNSATSLYQLIFIDGNGVTCYDRNMLHNLLKEHIYTRWIEYPVTDWSSGSIYGITEYSMICLKGNFSDFTVPAFLCEYVRMAELVLAQRATLLMFEGLLSDCSLGLINVKTIEEKYVLFQNQLLLKEISPEQQPIEVYNKLVGRAFVFQESEQIEKQIKNLFELENYKATSRENKVLFLLAILGLAEVFGFIENMIEKQLPWWGYCVWSAVWIVSGLLAAVFFSSHKRNKKKRK